MEQSVEGKHLNVSSFLFFIQGTALNTTANLLSLADPLLNCLLRYNSISELVSKMCSCNHGCKKQRYKADATNIIL